MDTRVFFLGFPHIPETCTAFLSVCGMFIQDIYPPIYLCTSCRCSGNSAFVPRHLPRHKGCVFRVFHIFSETITWTPGLFFSGFLHIAVVFFPGFPHIPRRCTAFLPVCDIFIRDIFPANYLCTSRRCSRHFAFFPGQLPRHLGCFIQVFCTSKCPMLSHQKRAPDALSVWKTPKNPHATWRHHKDGPKMRMTTFGMDQTCQDFCFPDDHPTMLGWFKGMDIIICERGLLLEQGLLAQCEGFKCVAGKTDCCCCWLLFMQPDFVVTFIPKIIVSSISVSNIGAVPN